VNPHYSSRLANTLVTISRIAVFLSAIGRKPDFTIVRIVPVSSENGHPQKCIF